MFAEMRDMEGNVSNVETKNVILEVLYLSSYYKH